MMAAQAAGRRRVRLDGGDCHIYDTTSSKSTAAQRDRARPELVLAHVIRFFDSSTRT